MRPAGTTRSLALTFAFIVLTAPGLRAQALSAYRQFHLGMTAAAVASELGVAPTAAKIVHTRPLLIQELEWRPPASPSSLEPDSVRLVLLDFCNGELYRMVVTYVPERVEGLTEEDMLQAMSPAYGRPTRPGSRIITSAAADTFTDTEQVVARWDDGTSSVNLFRSTYPAAFGLVIVSKRLAASARAAIDRAIEMDRLERPQREAAAGRVQAAADDATHAKARLVNKTLFKF